MCVDRVGKGVPTAHWADGHSRSVGNSCTRGFPEVPGPDGVPVLLFQLHRASLLTSRKQPPAWEGCQAGTAGGRRAGLRCRVPAAPACSLGPALLHQRRLPGARDGAKGLASPGTLAGS